MRKTGSYYLESFIPDPLPPSNPPLKFNGEALRLFSEASYELGRLNAVATRSSPDLKRFINTYVKKEALLTSEIENIQTTLVDVLANDADGFKPNKETQLVLNYIKALNIALNLMKDEGLPITSRIILSPHKALMTGEGDRSFPGQYRKQPVKVGEFKPPIASKVPELMGDLEKYINQVANDLPVLIKIGLVHVQFEIIHPFQDGNGRIGRMLIVLMLINNNLLNEPILYPSYYFKKHSTEYYLRLDQVRTKGDFEGWIIFYLKAIKYSCREACYRIEVIKVHEITLEEGIKDSSEFAKIRETSLTILKGLYRFPVFSIKQISEESGKSYNTVRSVIDHFLDLGWVVEHNKKTRNKLYCFKSYLECLEANYDKEIE
jgi:Fic family protein